MRLCAQNFLLMLKIEIIKILKNFGAILNQRKFHKQSNDLNKVF